MFGTFAADTKLSARSGSDTEPKGAVTLGIGKVFATGVAAQNLSEGLGKYLKQKGNGVNNDSCMAHGLEMLAAAKAAKMPDENMLKLVQQISDTCNAQANK